MQGLMLANDVWKDAEALKAMAVDWLRDAAKHELGSDAWWTARLRSRECLMMAEDAEKRAEAKAKLLLEEGGIDE